MAFHHKPQLRARSELEESGFAPETIDAMVEAIESLACTFNIRDRTEPLAELIAAKIIRLAQQGEDDPKRLHDLTLAFLPKTH